MQARLGARAGALIPALLLLVLLRIAAPAEAQQLGLLPPPEDAPAEWEAAAEAVMARIERDGEPVMSAAEVAQRSGSECADLGCAPDLARALSLRWIAALEVLPGGAAGAGVRVLLIEGRGRRFEGEASDPDGDVAGAARRALALARERWRAARLSALRVTAIEGPQREGALGEGVEGAEIYVDGELVGLTPAQVSVGPGLHRVSLRHLGRRFPERRVRLEVQERRELELELDMRAALDGERASRSAGPRRRAPSEWNWVLGGALAIGGVLALISPLQTIAQEGDCLMPVPVGPDGGPACREEVYIGPQTGVLLAVGIAALAGAAVIQIVQPITVEVAVDPEGASLRVGGRF